MCASCTLVWKSPAKPVWQVDGPGGSMLKYGCPTCRWVSSGCEECRPDYGLGSKITSRVRILRTADFQQALQPKLRHYIDAWASVASPIGRKSIRSLRSDHLQTNQNEQITALLDLPCKSASRLLCIKYCRHMPSSCPRLPFYI